VILPLANIILPLANIILPLANIFQPLIDAAEVAILFFHDDLGFGWGPAIVALTFTTRIIILPLSIKQIRSMRELQAIQPQMKAVQAKYKQDRQRMQQELMKLYKEHGVNPFGSCLPLVLQLPVFLSLFWLLRSEDFRMDVLAAPPDGWLFIDSLIVKPEGGELIALLALFIGTQFGAGLVMASRLEGAQRAIVFVLPLVIAPFIINFPAGLALYWITTNIWTLGQQFVVTKVAPPPPKHKPEDGDSAEPAKAPPRPPRKRKRRSGKRR
jgi:YidC/Oxa1 family membrane protein insertase